MTRASALAVMLALAAVLLSGAPAVAGEPDATVPAYDVALRAANHGMRWTGRETLTITNPGATPLARVWIRLWGNGISACKAPRPVRISGVTGGTAGAATVGCTAVPLDLDVPLAPGARGSVSWDVDVRAPRRHDRFGRRGRRIALFSNALPALAHLEGGAFRLDRYFSQGEAWTYPAAEWRVRFDAPAGVDVAAPGVVQPDGSRLLLNGRDYSFAAGRLRSVSRVIGGIRVTAWIDATRDGRGPERALAIARNRLPKLVRLYGPYGWPDLQIVVTNDTAMEHTGLVMSPAFDYVLTHELAHEWWYALIAGDQAEAPWLDEAFASYAEEAAGSQSTPWCRHPGGGTRMVTRGTAYFRDRHYAGYGNVYWGGACLLDLLRDRMGRARFDRALRDYALANRYGWSTAAEFRAEMDAASPVSLDDLWRRYRVA